MIFVIIYKVIIYFVEGNITTHLIGAQHVRTNFNAD